MKKKELIKHMLGCIEDLLEQNFEQVERAALDSDSDKAKASVKLEWGTGADEVKTLVRLSFSTTHQDEIESMFNPDQLELAIDRHLERKKAEPSGEEWNDPKDELPDADMLVMCELAPRGGGGNRLMVRCSYDDAERTWASEDFTTIEADDVLSWRHLTEAEV
jgi:hypothetical protein